MIFNFSQKLELTNTQRLELTTEEKESIIAQCFDEESKIPNWNDRIETVFLVQYKGTFI